MQNKKDGIFGFDGEFSFLSNFYSSKVKYNNIEYLNSEAAFQSMKTLDINERLEFANLPAGRSKRKGRSVSLREDWDSIKMKTMYEIVKAKFSQNEEIKKKLIETGSLYLEETNTWNDTFWGVCDGVGQNNLGLILMKIRKEFIDEKKLQKIDYVKIIEEYMDSEGFTKYASSKDDKWTVWVTSYKFGRTQDSEISLYIETIVPDDISDIKHITGEFTYLTKDGITISAGKFSSIFDSQRFNKMLNKIAAKIIAIKSCGED